ncbi:MAG TPA: ABC transporter permease subunit [Acidimicrobiia bacterium]|nr:ABC transporter permease subunit [Acidimicrobiia bacterium]
MRASGGRASAAALRLLVVPAGLVVLWQLATLVVTNPAFVSPVETLSELQESLTEPRVLRSIGDTVQAVVAAFLLAGAGGVLAGSLLGLSRYWFEAVSPLLYGLNSIPKLTLYPIFLLVFGLGLDSRVAFGTFHGLFVMSLIMAEAVQTLPAVYRKLMRTYRMGPVQTIRHVVAPALLPFLVTGLRLTFALTLIGVVIAELFSATSGIGHELMRDVSLARTDRILALVVIVVSIALVPSSVLRLLDRRVTERYGLRSAGEVERAGGH